MTTQLEQRIARLRKAINLQRPDRMPLVGQDARSCEYRPDLYHLGEMEHVERGQVATSKDGKRKVTWDGGVWAVDAQEKYHSADDVLNVALERFAPEEVGPAMLAEMRRIYNEKAAVAFVTPWHYGTLISRAVIEFGWEPFLLASALDPERMGQILDRFGQASLAVIQGWMQISELELLVVHDDIAGTRGVIMSPRWYRRYVFPWYERFFAAIHAAGRKVLYISDGNYAQVLDDILATGADGLYIESSSMNPRAFMQRAGRDKLYMLKSDNRNIDFGTPDEIRREVQEIAALHAEYSGMMMYRGGGNPLPGNAEAFEAAFQEFLVYERE